MAFWGMVEREDVAMGELWRLKSSDFQGRRLGFSLAGSLVGSLVWFEMFKYFC